MLVIVGRPKCDYCTKAKEHCEKNGVIYEYFDMTDNDGAIRNLVVAMGATTVPQIFDGFHHIGGYTELLQYNP